MAAIWHLVFGNRHLEFLSDICELFDTDNDIFKKIENALHYVEWNYLKWIAGNVILISLPLISSSSNVVELSVDSLTWEPSPFLTIILRPKEKMFII